jgi:hypothetical protein
MRLTLRSSRQPWWFLCLYFSDDWLAGQALRHHCSTPPLGDHNFGDWGYEYRALTPSPKISHAFEELDDGVSDDTLDNMFFEGHQGGSSLDPFDLLVAENEGMLFEGLHESSELHEETAPLPVAVEGRMLLEGRQVRSELDLLESFSDDDDSSIYDEGTAPLPVAREEIGPNGVLLNRSETYYISGAEAAPLVVTHEDIGPNDVLVGRGPTYYNHSGNQFFLHELKPKFQPKYRCAQKKEKRGIAQQMVKEVFRSGGRFLERIPETSLWMVVTKKRAREKASQTLRESLTPEERRAKREKYPKKARRKSQ